MTFRQLGSHAGHDRQPTRFSCQPPPRRQEELAEYVEMWQDKMRRLEAHGEKFKMALLCALRMLITGKAKVYFNLWEADHDPTNAAKTYEELLNKFKYYARRRKLDSSA